MSVGGTHTLAHAMANAGMKQGVCLRFTKPVVRIVLRDGRAAGIQLKDGTEIGATMLVASNVDPKQTFIDFIGEENLQPFRRERLAHWRFGPEHVLGTPSFALHEAPAYKSSRWNADIDRCFYTLVGFETPEQMSDYIIQAYGGAIPSRPGAGTWVNSLWDPTQAPPGKHAMNGWFFFPRASCLTPEEWDEIRCTYNDRFLRLWGDYAPNMTCGNVIAQRLYTSFDMERKIGMPEGDFSHGRAGGARVQVLAVRGLVRVGRGDALCHAGRIEAVRRLIEDEQLRVVEERSGEAKALLHALRVRAHLVAAAAREAY
jgi:phytoene dehydrogenase-like protein